MGDVESAWAFNAHRRGILDEFNSFISSLRSKLRISGVWISGSFISDKEEPGDIDAVLLIDKDILESITDPTLRQFLDPNNFTLFVKRAGYRIDAYILPWRPRPSLEMTSNEEYSLMANRGYWDDFWQRRRTVPNGAQPTRQCALPARGYLEVILDGFE